MSELPLLHRSVVVLKLSTRVENRLYLAGIATVGQLAATPAPELLDIPRFGYRCLVEVIDALARHGLQLPEWHPALSRAARLSGGRRDAEVMQTRERVDALLDEVSRLRRALEDVGDDLEFVLSNRTLQNEAPGAFAALHRVFTRVDGALHP